MVTTTSMRNSTLYISLSAKQLFVKAPNVPLFVATRGGGGDSSQSVSQSGPVPSAYTPPPPCAPIRPRPSATLEATWTCSNITGSRQRRRRLLCCCYFFWVEATWSVGRSPSTTSCWKCLHHCHIIIARATWIQVKYKVIIIIIIMVEQQEKKSDPSWRCCTRTRRAVPVTKSTTMWLK